MTSIRFKNLHHVKLDKASIEIEGFAISVKDSVNKSKDIINL